MFTKTTRAITITAIPQFLPEQSDAEASHYVWAYTIIIENHGHDTVQLLNRHWRITDGNGQLQEVHGAGVVGEQPILSAGNVFRYSSGTALSTPSGIMVGTYQMTTPSGDIFDVDIPAFSLDSPYQITRLH